MTGMPYVLSVARTRPVYIHCHQEASNSLAVAVHAEQIPDETDHLAQMSNCVVWQVIT